MSFRLDLKPADRLPLMPFYTCMGSGRMLISAVMEILCQTSWPLVYNFYLCCGFSMQVPLLFQIYFNFLLKLSYPIEKLFLLPAGLFIYTLSEIVTNIDLILFKHVVNWENPFFSFLC